MDQLLQLDLTHTINSIWMMLIHSELLILNSWLLLVAQELVLQEESWDSQDHILSHMRVQTTGEDLFSSKDFITHQLFQLRYSHSTMLIILINHSILLVIMILAIPIILMILYGLASKTKCTGCQL